MASFPTSLLNLSLRAPHASKIHDPEGDVADCLNEVVHQDTEDNLIEAMESGDEMMGMGPGRWDYCHESAEWYVGVGCVEQAQLLLMCRLLTSQLCSEKSTVISPKEYGECLTTFALTRCTSKCPVE